MKLKTLKDFKGIDGYGEPEKDKRIYADEHIFINRLDLKQEAIKEIKWLKSEDSYTDFIHDCEAFGHYTKNNVIDYIKWKNNIIEEELK